jgi:ABC-2 type transport system ATP-binding protein
MANFVIETNNLTKIYGEGGKRAFKALDNLTLNVEQGEIFGYLGPNGAGKTTTIRLLLDLIRPTSGTAKLLGADVRENSVSLHSKIGFLPAELNLWKNLTGKQVVDYIASIRGDDGSMKKHAQEIGERLSLDFSRKVREYSSGNKRKLGLVVSMMHKPELLILDEPTSSLDPLLQQTFNQMMREIRDQGRTIFLSSHILAEVQAICDRVGILRNGQLRAVERVHDLTDAKFQWVELHFHDAVATTLVNGVPNVTDVTLAADNILRLRLSGDWDPLLKAINGQYVIKVESEDPSLEEIFLTFYGDEAKPPAPLEKELA